MLHKGLLEPVQGAPCYALAIILSIQDGYPPYPGCQHAQASLVDGEHMPSMLGKSGVTSNVVYMV